jgi:hypothetical protein
MALEYKLALQEPEDETAVVGRLASVDGFVRGGDGIQAPDLFVSIRKPSDLTLEVIEDEFDFVPYVQVRFRLDGNGDTDTARMRIARACVTLLRFGAGDAVLLFNGERVVLLRKNGQLVLNRDLGFWTDERLALVTLPYRLDSIPHI